MYADGAGLYLQVARGGSKSWIYRYRLNAREREMGLGPLHTVSLAEARDAALEARKLKLKGIDPIEAKRSAAMERRIDAARAMTFDGAVTAYLKTRAGAWGNAKHSAQWESTLQTYRSADRTCQSQRWIAMICGLQTVRTVTSGQGEHGAGRCMTTFPSYSRPS